jgi:hypothetical protein
MVPTSGRGAGARAHDRQRQSLQRVAENAMVPTRGWGAAAAGYTATRATLPTPKSFSNGESIGTWSIFLFFVFFTFFRLGTSSSPCLEKVTFSQSWERRGESGEVEADPGNRAPSVRFNRRTAGTKT